MCFIELGGDGVKREIQDKKICNGHGKTKRKLSSQVKM